VKLMRDAEVERGRALAAKATAEDALAGESSAKVRAEEQRQRAVSAQQSAEAEKRTADGERGKAVAAREAADKARGEADAAREAGARVKQEVSDGRERLAGLEYARPVDLAYREWKENNFARARALLESCRADLRGWEWDYVHRLCHADQLTLGGRRQV